MPVNLLVPENIYQVPGVRLGTSCAGIKQTDRDDVALIVFESGTSVAGVYTQSSFKAAPVVVAKENEDKSLAWVINSGNANAATGSRGEEDARSTCEVVASEVLGEASSVQPFSTGVIGEFLPMEKLATGIKKAFQALDLDAWLQAAKAIMTTDTTPKITSSRHKLGEAEVTVTGISKGAGMMRPNMATMLAFIASDAAVDKKILKELVKEVADSSFNRITIDGDTSTNDCFMVGCTGLADMLPIQDKQDPRYLSLKSLLIMHSQELAQAIVRDGEGATKFVTVRVEGGLDEKECLAVAYSIAESPLVKTALFAGDANWGRLCMAIGKAPVENLDNSLVGLWLDDVSVATRGMLSDSYDDAQGAGVLAKSEFLIRVDLGRGPCSADIWTTDLSYDYVKINAEYRT